MSVETFLVEKGAKMESALRAHLASCRNAPPSLRDAMEYSLLAGGKRLRPALALGAAEIVCGDDAPALPAACAIEMIHTYSLIHDDLPAMDNDDLRRGRPTSHKVYGEALAILAGDALLTLAFHIVAQSGNARVIAEVARAAGAEGMVGGQVLDMQSEGRELTLEQLQQVHALKTGALIRVSVRAGALLAGASDSQLDALTQYGRHVGLAFQIADDILNVTGTEEALGKPVGSDAAHRKATYPAIVGLHRARRFGEEAVAAAAAALAPFGPEADNLRALARFIIERDR